MKPSRLIGSTLWVDIKELQFKIANHRPVHLHCAPCRERQCRAPTLLWSVRMLPAWQGCRELARLLDLHCTSDACCGLPERLTHPSS